MLPGAGGDGVGIDFIVISFRTHGGGSRGDSPEGWKPAIQDVEYAFDALKLAAMQTAA